MRDLTPNLLTTARHFWQHLSRRVRFLAGGALLVAGIAVDATSRATEGFHPPAALRLGLIIAGAAVAALAALSEAHNRRHQRDAFLRARLRWYGPPLPIVADIDPYRIGVTPSRLAESRAAAHEGDRPPYIPRDIDSRLDEALATSSLVIVTGRSKAGKSRSAFEALLRGHVRSKVIVPASPSVLRDLLELDPPLDAQTATAVLWLDNLEDYLDSDPLVANLLEGLLVRHPALVVVATMRTGSLELLQSSESGAAQAANDLLQLGRRIDLRTSGDSWDRPKAASLYPAVDFSAAGIGAYFTATEELLTKYRTGAEGVRVGAAIVQAAVDWRRTGLTRPIPRDQLERLAGSYLPDTDPSLVDHTAGLEWANAEVSSSVRLVHYVETADGAGLVAADPILEYDDYHRRVPEAAWTFAIDAAHEKELLAIAASAYSRGEAKANEAALALAAKSENREIFAMAAYNLGAAAFNKGDSETATNWLQQAADADHPLADFALGQDARARGNETEAEVHFKRAIEHNDVRAMLALGHISAKASASEEAEDYFRQAAATGYPDAISLLAEFLANQGRVDEAIGVYQTDADARNPTTALGLGRLFAHLGRNEEAEEQYRAGAAAGFFPAVEALAAHLAHDGRLTEAVEVLETPAFAGNPEAALALARLLFIHDRRDEGIKWLQRAADSGFPPALQAAAAEFAAAGRPDIAERLYEHAANAGNVNAAVGLAVLLLELGRPLEAEEWYRRAAKVGLPHAAGSLGVLLWSRGLLDEAEPWLRRGAEGGDPESATNFGNFLIERGDTEQAKTWLERAVEADDVRAMLALAGLAAMEDDEAASLEWLRRAAEGESRAIPGNHTARRVVAPTAPESADQWKSSTPWELATQSRSAACELGGALLAKGEAAAAEPWLRSASLEGDERATLMLALSLLRQGRPDEAVELTQQVQLGPNSDAELVFHVGRPLRDAGETEEGERLLRFAAEAGHAGAANSLGQLLLHQGNDVDAEAWYRKAVAAEEPFAANNLGNLLMILRNNLAEAEPFLRQALDGGVEIAASGLAHLLEATDRTDEAEAILRRYAEQGNVPAMFNLGKLLERLGRPAEGEEWLTRVQAAAKGGGQVLHSDSTPPKSS